LTLVELGTYLISQGIGTTLDVDVFLGKMPATPDVAVALFEYGSLPAQPNLSGGGASPGTLIRYEFPRIQILVRGVKDDYSGPWTVAKNARKAMLAIQNQTLSGTYYISALPENGPFFLRRDTNDRVEFAANYQVEKAES